MALLTDISTETARWISGELCLTIVGSHSLALRYSFIKVLGIDGHDLLDASASGESYKL
jgi:hypothetical protein